MLSFQISNIFLQAVVVVVVVVVVVFIGRSLLGRLIIIVFLVTIFAFANEMVAV